MKTLKIYLDTSIINFLYADDAPEKKEITVEFFDRFIRTGSYTTFISNIVTAEIEETKDYLKRSKLLQVLKDYPINHVDIQSSDEIKLLANLYLNQNIIPKNKVADAFHVAITVANNIEVLVSWNFRHLANVNKERKINAVNLANNFVHSIRIVTPLELLSYE